MEGPMPDFHAEARTMVEPEMVREAEGGVAASGAGTWVPEVGEGTLPLSV